MTRPLKVGVAPINSTVGDVRGNTDEHIRIARRLGNRGCQFVVFPKMGIMGCSVGNLTQWRGLVENAWVELERFAKETKGINTHFVIGLPVQHQGKVYAAAALVYEGEVTGVAPQTRIPTSDQALFATAHFRRLRSLGKETAFGRGNFIVGPGDIAVIIGEDLDDQNLTARVSRAEIVIVQEARPYQSGITARERLKKLLALSKGRTVITVNAYGMNEGLTFDGDCLVIKDGQVLRETTVLDRGKSSVVTVDRTPKQEDAPKSKRLRHTTRPWDEKLLWRLAFERRVLGALDYLRKSGMKGFAIAESGGRDSMFATIVALEALNRFFAHLKPKVRRRAVRDAIICIGMPTKNNTAKTRGIARKFCRQLGIPYVEVPIGRLHNANMRALQKMLGKRGEITRIARQNGQARQRSLLVTTLVNCLGFLMINTCDGIEDWFGFATKYGDGCGDIGAAEDLDKSDIEGILWWYFNVTGRKVKAIRECLNETVAGPELEKGQTAEGDLFPYPVGEYIRYLFEKKHLMPSEIYLRIRQRWTEGELKERFGCTSGAILKRWVTRAVRMRLQNVHKLSVAPLGLAVDPENTLDRRFNQLPIMTRNVFAADLQYLQTLPE